MSQKLDQGLPVELLKKISQLYAINMQDLKDLGGMENDVYGFSRGKESFILRIGSTKHMSISLVFTRCLLGAQYSLKERNFAIHKETL